MYQNTRNHDDAHRRWLFAWFLLTLTACGAVGTHQTGASAREHARAAQVRASVAALEDPSSPHRVRSARHLRVLVGIVPAALPALLRVADDDQPAVRREARLVLSERQDALVALACSHHDAQLRAAAVPWIQASAMLMDVVMQAPSDTARLAIQHIREPERLVAVALEGPASVRTDAVQRLSQLPLLARVARVGKPDVATAARARIAEHLRSVSDLWTLSELAAGSQPEISQAAVDELGALTRDSERGRRVAALGRLIVLAHSAPAERRPAIAAHVSRARPLLLEVATDGPDDAARALLESMLDDLEVQAALATHKNVAIARMALERNRDARVVEAAMTHRDPAVRIAALGRIQDTEQLIQALRREPSPRVQLTITAHMTDKRALRRISRLTGRSVVARVAKFLLRQRERGNKPVVALRVQSDRRLRRLVRRTAADLLSGHVFLFECKSDEECEPFATQLRVDASVEDSNQCYDQFYVGGTCKSLGKSVEIVYAFHRDDEVVDRVAFQVLTPDVVRGRSSIFEFKTHPSKAEVWRATWRKLKRQAKLWSFGTLNVAAWAR